MSDADRARGALIGDYVVLDPIARGRTGVVYRAYEQARHRRVAIKVVAVPRAPGGPTAVLDRARSLTGLTHVNVAGVADVGVMDGEIFLVMELVEGRTLARWLRRTTRHWSAVRDAFVQAGRGLAAGHAQGVVHGEFDAEHAMIDSNGAVRVVGFGLAASLATPLQTSDPLVDQRSFCAALWVALHGSAGAGSTGLPETVDASSDVPAEIDQALRRGLSPERDARWPQLIDLLTVLSVAGPDVRVESPPLPEPPRS